MSDNKVSILLMESQSEMILKKLYIIENKQEQLQNLRIEVQNMYKQQ